MSTVFILQHYLLYNNIYCTGVFIVQQCLFTKIFLNILFKRDRPAAWGYQFGDMEILYKISTVQTAVTMRLCCVFCNSMQYSENCDVFIVENTESYETSWFSVKVTAVMLVNTLVFDLGKGLGH